MSNTIKHCSCGKEYLFVPDSAIEWRLAENAFWLWPCDCKSHLVSPIDEATAKRIGGVVLEKRCVSDLVKEAKERALIEDYEESESDYRFGSDDEGGL